MAGAAEGAVDDEARRHRRKQLDDIAQHDGHMFERLVAEPAQNPRSLNLRAWSAFVR
mgnify:CR=1 FL=1